MSAPNFREVRLGPWLPDLGGQPSQQFPGYLVTAEGVKTTPGGLRPIPNFENIGTASVGTVPGRLYATDINGTLNVFACSASTGPTNTRIQQKAGESASWNDIEGASGAPGLWADFCEFDNLLICGSRARAPQQKDLFAAASTALADLSGSPPTGATIARVRDHVVIGNLTTDNISRSAVRWCAIGDPEDWPTPGTSDAASKEAGIQYLPRHLGQVTKVMGGEKFGLIFQERGITRMTYVGGRVVYEFDTYDRIVGSGLVGNDSADSVVIPHPVVDVGGVFIWASSIAQGIFATDGFATKKLSQGIFGQNEIFQPPSISSSVAYDQYSNVVVLPRVIGGTGGVLYNQATGEFSNSSDTLNSVCSRPAVITTTGTINIFNLSSAVTLQKKTSGTEETVTLQTGYIEIDPGFRVQLQGVELVGVNTPASLAFSAKGVSDVEGIGTSSAGFTALTEQALGKRMAGRVSGRWMAFRITGAPSLLTDTFHSLRIYFQRVEPAR